MTVWWHPKAVLAADFKNARYGLFALSSTLAGIEATVRASSALFADTNGVYQSFANNTLARNDGLGAYVGGQVTGYVKNNTDASVSATWNNGYGLTRTKLSGTRLGIFSRVSVASGGATYHRIATNVFNPTAGPHYVSVFWEPGTSGLVHVELTHNSGVYLIYGAPGAVSGAVFSGSPGAVSGLTDVDAGDGITRKLTFKWTPVDASNSTLSIGPHSGVAGQTIIICGCDAQPVGYESPFIVSGATVATRSASDVTAVASGGAPFAGFAASGLAAALSARVAVNLSHVGDGVGRPLLDISDGTVNNRLRLYVDTDDKPAAAVVSGGVTLASVKLASALTTARSVFAVNFDPVGGLYLVRLSGLEEASASLSAMPSGLTTMRYGSSPTPNYLNDTIEEVQVAQALSQAAAKTWVQNIATGSLASALEGATLAAAGQASARGGLAAAMGDTGLAGGGAAGVVGQVAAIMQDALLGASAAAAAEGSLAATLEDADLDASAHLGAPASRRLEIAGTRPGPLTLTGVWPGAQTLTRRI